MTATFFFCAVLCAGISLLFGEYTLGKPDDTCAEMMGGVFSVMFGLASASCLFGFVFCLYWGA